MSGPAKLGTYHPKEWKGRRVLENPTRDDGKAVRARCDNDDCKEEGDAPYEFVWPVEEITAGGRNRRVCAVVARPAIGSHGGPLVMTISHDCGLTVA